MLKNNVSIELNKQYLKIVYSRSMAAKPSISNCIVSNIASLTDEQISAEIVNVLHREKISSKTVSVCLPRDFVTVRNIHLPSQDQNEISQMIELHIGRVVPYKKDEIVFGYKTSGLDEMGYSRVILAIVQIDVLRRQAKILEKAGLSVENISLSSYESLQWVYRNCQNNIGRSDIYLLLDVDSSCTDFIIFSQHGLLFTRSISMGMDSLRTKDSFGFVKLVGEMKQSIIVFHNEEVSSKLVSIFITGCRDISAISDTISEEMELPVKIVPCPCLKDFSKAEKMNVPSDVSLTAVSELSLELGKKSFNFILPELQVRKQLKEKTRDLFIFAACFVYLFTIICLVFVGRIYVKQNYLNKLESRYVSIDKEIRDLVEKSSQVEKLKGFLDERKSDFIIINRIQRLVPAEITIDYIGIDSKNSITLKGQALQLSDVFKFVTSLEKSTFFKDIQQKSTRKRKLRDKEVTDFELIFNSN